VKRSRGTTVSTATGESVEFRSNDEQGGQTAPDGQYQPSCLHRDPDDQDHRNPRKTQDIDSGEYSDLGSATETEKEDASNAEPRTSDCRGQSAAPGHKTDAQEENGPRKSELTRASGKERAQSPQPLEEPRTTGTRLEKQNRPAPREDADFWRDKATAHRDEIERLQNTITNLQRTIGEERVRFVSTREELFQEKTKLKKRLDTLQTSHIQSINSVGTGLESISDKTFETKFRALQDEVY
jgi:predicted  nucleic acid-binding Zn-ribbon protein